MTSNFRKLSALAMGVACALLCERAVAIEILDGSVQLPSAFGGGNFVTINYDVDLNAGVYTYQYQVVNGPSGAANLNFFSVTFDATPLGAVTGGNYAHLKATGVDWSFGPLGLGGATPAVDTAGVLFFTSLLAPKWGPADASDEIPPSPFVSGPNVPVPGIPDGGLTVALLGLALVGIDGLRRKLVK